MQNKRKEIQTARMWRYFLDAAAEIIEEKGFQKLTIREIADRAGFTSSTVYNYFQDLSHLKFFAVMRYTNDYVKELPAYMEKGSNTVETWLYSWECFCKHSFAKPEIYSLLFIENLGSIPEELLQHYYKIFAHDLVDLPESIRSIIVEHHISTRGNLFIQQAVEEGFLEENDVEFLADTTMHIWTGVLTNTLNLRKKVTKQEATELTMRYIHRVVMQTIAPDRRNEVYYSHSVNA